MPYLLQDCPHDCPHDQLRRAHAQVPDAHGVTPEEFSEVWECVSCGCITPITEVKHPTPGPWHGSGSWHAEMAANGHVNFTLEGEIT